MLRFLCLCLMLAAGCFGDDSSIYLRDNLRHAHPGDFIVAIQNKAYTLLHIHNKNGGSMVIEEITVPCSRINPQTTAWREWVMKGAPGSTSWILYALDLHTAKPGKYYSVTKNSWFEMPERDNFLATLLNLRLERLSDRERKKVGVAVIPNADSRKAWNPKLVVDGQTVPNAAFNAWRTQWPHDGSEASGKIIEVYTPEDPQYPSYFPYWLQISGVVGNAKVRIVDSGSGLISPAPTVFDPNA